MAIEKYILETAQLAIGYATHKPVLKDITIHIPKGKLIGLVGINGSGKSTLLRTLSGLQPPLAGTIHIQDQPITNFTAPALAQQLSVVLTGQHISQQLTVAELIALGRQPYTNWAGKLQDSDYDYITKAMQATSVTTLQDRKCGTLSDGQLQRVCIARALAQDTQLILLDEPLAHLDLHHEAALLKLLETIAHIHHKTIVFSTHEISHALPLCDAFMVIKDNKLHFDHTEQLIEKDVFDAMFPNTHVAFDKDSKRFFIRT